jgi:hypothetical protein
LWSLHVSCQIILLSPLALSCSLLITSLLLFLFLFRFISMVTFFCLRGGFEFSASHMVAGTLPLEPLCQSFSCVGYFWDDRVSWTICPCWLQTFVFLITASRIARITGVNHWCLALFFFWSSILWPYQ